MSHAALPDTDPPKPDSWLTRNKLAIAPWFFLAPALIFFAQKAARSPLAQGWLCLPPSASR